MSSEHPKPGLVATVLATISGNLYLVIGGLVFGFLTITLGLFFRPGRVFRVMGKWYGRTTLWFCGVRLRAVFEESMTGSGNFILMPNHSSLFDIPVLLATLPGETRFLAKQSLFRIPVWGWALRTGGFIPVDRGDRKRAGDAFKTALQGLGDGVSILLFPEETRTTDGRLQEFKRGGFLMALRTGLPVVPVGIDGTYEVRRKGSFLIRPGTVTVHYGRVLSSEGLALRDKQVLMNRVRLEVARLAGLEA